MAVFRRNSANSWQKMPSLINRSMATLSSVASILYPPPASQVALATGRREGFVMNRITKSLNASLTKLFSVLLVLVSCGCATSTTRVAVRPGFWFVNESAAKGSTAVTIKKVHPASIAGKSPSFTTDLKTHISGYAHDFDHSGGNATPFIPTYTPKSVGRHTSGGWSTTTYEAEYIRQRSGVILVRKFEDARTMDHNYIGVKRNSFSLASHRR
jgi:hypothetical protein